MLMPEQGSSKFKNLIKSGTAAQGKGLQSPVCGQRSAVNGLQLTINCRLQIAHCRGIIINE
jgi:hypothetical protein